MKRIAIIFAFLSLGIQIASAQNSFREIANRYKNQEHYFNTELSKHTINLYLKEKQPDNDLKTVLENIDNLKVLSFTINNQDVASSFLNDIDKHFNLKKYNPFKIKTSGFDQQKIYLTEDKDKITSLLVINTSLNRASMVEISGDLDLEKMALLNNVLNIDGLESLNNITDPDEHQKNQAKGHPALPAQSSQIQLANRISNEDFLPDKINNYLSETDDKGIRIYNKYGTKLMDTRSPFVLINGYQTKIDFKSSISEISPECIQSINVQKNNSERYPNGLIDITLNGDVNQLFTVCEGMLYFGQNGYLQSIKIDDECSPALLHNCQKKPLSEIVDMKPEEIKSIELTTDPRDCEGILEGEFVVVETN